ncbi:hypothetical protein KDA_08050 [Dictyobacter alpinus]|uniref:Uncharacterized protein n=1 Tax=Dictyobacter alpinus TaxID=2014873 RepID=A0A402B1U7_9CHLR|nr:hypothetical protein [Dictyobacter alpinus]GCE25321.1 hypothetical protein KDA_08050 [Dictyobacter alpinus]
MLKAVAAALVFIIGAAVVLWYANTLNSWVVGGLIGGLAALLLSIPISLTLFAYLSRRHEQHVQPDVEYEEEEFYAEPQQFVYEYREVPERVARTIYIEEQDDYPTGHRGRDEDYEDERHYLPAPAPRRQLPSPSSRYSDSDRYPVYRSPSTQSPSTRQPSRRDNETPSRRATTRRLNTPGFPGYQPEMTRGQFQSQALRIARQEASQRAEEDYTEEYVDYRSRRPSSPLSRQHGTDKQPTQKPPTSHGYRQSSRERQDPEEGNSSSLETYPRRGRRVVDASPTPNSPYRSFSSSQERPASQKYQYTDPETEAFDQNFSTGNLKKPLVRRAPYMYDDDALKDELAQQVEPPKTRRSSRNLAPKRDED